MIAERFDLDYTFPARGAVWLRVDKFLKLSKLVKRRTVAQEMLERGAARVNGRVCKLAYSVNVEDTIEVAYPNRIITVKVLTIDESMLKRNAPAYELLSEKRAVKDERPW